MFFFTLRSVYSPGKQGYCHSTYNLPQLPNHYGYPQHLQCSLSGWISLVINVLDAKEAMKMRDSKNLMKYEVFS